MLFTESHCTGLCMEYTYISTLFSQVHRAQFLLLWCSAIFCILLNQQCHNLVDNNMLLESFSPVIALKCQHFGIAASVFQVGFSLLFFQPKVSFISHPPTRCFLSSTYYLQHFVFRASILYAIRTFSSPTP